ncbi:MAG: hypothetical protein V1799_00890 [bacterium]
MELVRVPNVALPLLTDERSIYNAPDEERALACLLNPVDGPSGRTSPHLFKAGGPNPGLWAADWRPIGAADQRLAYTRACSRGRLPAAAA